MLNKLWETTDTMEEEHYTPPTNDNEDKEVKKEVYEVEKKLNVEQLKNQFKQFASEIGLMNISLMLIIAILPPTVALLTVIMLLGMEFIATREEEDVEALVKEVRHRVDE